MGKRLVLVVEDQAILGTLYEDALRLVGFEVKIIRDGLAAINYIEIGEIPEFIILDINLPRMSGRDVLHHIRKRDNYATVPVLVITANSVMAERVTDELTAYDRLLIKPVQMKDLQAFAKQIHTRESNTPPDFIAETQETRGIQDTQLAQSDDGDSASSVD